MAGHEETLESFLEPYRESDANEADANESDIIEDDLDRALRGINREFADKRRLPAMPALIIARRFTYSDFYAMLLNRLVWLDEGVYLFPRSEDNEQEYYDFNTYTFKAGGGEGITLAVHSSRGSRRPVGGHRWINRMCHVLGTSTESTVSIEGPLDGWMPIPVDCLSLLVETHQNLKVVRLERFSLFEETVQFIGAASTTGVDVELSLCTVRIDGTDDVEDVLLESIRSNRGPTEMRTVTLGWPGGAHIDVTGLLEALRDNTRLKALEIKINPHLNPHHFDAESFQSLSMNKGITDLTVTEVSKTEHWTHLCRSLESNQTVENLKITVENLRLPRNVYGAPDPEVSEAEATQAVLDMMKINTTIQSIDLPDFNNNPLYEEGILPLVRCNQFRPRLVAIRQAPAHLQSDLVGQEMLNFADNLDSVFMLLMQFPEFLALAPRDSPVGDDDKGNARRLRRRLV
jgi:hypothetical protein